jgi:hypothetical protein
MITSAPNALSLQENAIDDMCGRALKGLAAVNCLRHLLANGGKPLDTDDLRNPGGSRPNQQSRNKLSAFLM